MKSLVAPFRIENGRVASTSSPSQAASAKIVNALVTVAGERTGVPTYGASLTSFLFEPLDDLAFTDFKIDAIQELKARISGIDILNLSIAPDPLLGDTHVNVKVVYRLPLSSPQVISFRVAVPGELTEESDF